MSSNDNEEINGLTLGKIIVNILIGETVIVLGIGSENLSSNSEQICSSSTSCKWLWKKNECIGFTFNYCLTGSVA